MHVLLHTVEHNKCDESYCAQGICCRREPWPSNVSSHIITQKGDPRETAHVGYSKRDEGEGKGVEWCNGRSARCAVVINGQNTRRLALRGGGRPANTTKEGTGDA